MGATQRHRQIIIRPSRREASTGVLVTLSVSVSVSVSFHLNFILDIVGFGNLWSGSLDTVWFGGHLFQIRISWFGQLVGFGGHKAKLRNLTDTISYSKLSVSRRDTYYHSYKNLPAVGGVQCVVCGVECVVCLLSCWVSVFCCSSLSQNIPLAHCKEQS